MKRLAGILGLILLLTGCGGAARTRRSLPPASLRVDVATSRFAALPLYLGVRAGPVALAPRRTSAAAALSDLRAGRVFAAVLSPPSIVGDSSGLLIVERLASSTPDMLLAHGGTFFHWQDISGAPVVLAADDAQVFEAAMAPYRRYVKVPPLVLAGGVAAFDKWPYGFFVAPEPLASSLVGAKRAHLALSLGAETGPWPAAVLVVSQAEAKRWPRLLAFTVTALWQNELTADETGVSALAKRLSPVFPAIGQGVLARALGEARHVGVLPTDPRVVPPEGSRLGVVFPQMDWQPFLGAVDQRDAEAALRRVF